MYWAETLLYIKQRLLMIYAPTDGILTLFIFNTNNCWCCSTKRQISICVRIKFSQLKWHHWCTYLSYFNFFGSSYFLTCLSIHLMLLSVSHYSPCTWNNKIFYIALYRSAVQRFKQTIISARYGGPTEATRRLLALLPISAQSYSCTPYLDLSLFSYDDKWISPMERPKGCGEHPIR